MTQRVSVRRGPRAILRRVLVVCRKPMWNNACRRPPASAETFIKQADPGSYYVEFDVPSSSVRTTSAGVAKIVGPNSLEGRLATMKGTPVPQMPAASNIVHSATKLR